jgi:hypothetical protein
VLRLLDARTGAYAEVSPASRGLLRLCAHVPGASGITGLRVLLVADLLARVAELGKLQALTVLVTDGEFPGQGRAVERAAAAFGIHPPAGPASPGDAEALLGGPVDVHVVSCGAGTDDSQGGVVTCVGDAHMPGTAARGGATADLLAGNEDDPLAVRLALMSFPSRQPADLTDSVLGGARETVGDWRHRVARWAESPSRPIPAHLAETARAAFGDLDIPSAIALLRGLVHDGTVPAGAKFETFLYVDRVLGLDLPREIGKLD